MAEKEKKTDFRSEDRLLIAALLLASSGWVLHLNVSYILVPESCSNDSKMMLHGLTVVCLAITLVGGSIAWKVRRAEAVEYVAERMRWMATAIVVFAVALAMVIIAQEIPNLILRSCD